MALCLRCEKNKPRSAFPDDKWRKSGKHPYCRTCKAKEQREREHAKTLERQRIGRTCEDCGDRCTVAADGTNKARVCAVCRKHRERRELETAKVRYRSKYPTRSKAWHADFGLKQTRTREANKRKWVQRLGGVCQSCGLAISTKWPATCFDFHHINETGKTMSIGNALRSPKRLEKAIEEELRGCIVLCSNCHRKLHYYADIERREREIENERRTNDLG